MGDDRDFHSPQYRAFRAAVRKRDRGRCRFPGCTTNSGRRIVHHIRRWADSPELRFDVSNGVLLCNNHHVRVSGHEDEYAPLFLSLVSKVSSDIRMASLLARYADPLP